jgi:hypothetical protein
MPDLSSLLCLLTDDGDPDGDPKGSNPRDIRVRARGGGYGGLVMPTMCYRSGYKQVENYKTRQDKTRYDNIRELRVLLIHQLVLICWRTIPQTISFYNLEPY